MARLERISRSPWFWLGAAIALVVMIFLAIAVLPPLFVRNTSRMTEAEVLKSENDVRTTLLTAIAGLLFTITAFFAWRQIQVARRQVQVTQEGQITDRFTKAIEQLGKRAKSDEPDPMDVRIGGIYALERLALDSDRDRPVVYEVLAAFVREHSADFRRQGSRSRLTGSADDTSADVTPVLRPAADADAALTVLGRRRTDPDDRRLDLTRADLSRLDLARGRLSMTDLTGADLTGANLTEANLTDADLTCADLTGANLFEADLIGADLTDITFDANTKAAPALRRRSTFSRVSSSRHRRAVDVGRSLAVAMVAVLTAPSAPTITSSTRRRLAGRQSRASRFSSGQVSMRWRPMASSPAWMRRSCTLSRGDPSCWGTTSTSLV
jgi:hypothetical protein